MESVNILQAIIWKQRRRRHQTDDVQLPPSATAYQNMINFKNKSCWVQLNNDFLSLINARRNKMAHRFTIKGIALKKTLTGIFTACWRRIFWQIIVNSDAQNNCSSQQAPLQTGLLMTSAVEAAEDERDGRRPSNERHFWTASGSNFTAWARIASAEADQRCERARARDIQ